MINYNNRKFRPIHNDSEGDVDPTSIFHYYQDGNIVTGTYSGKHIRYGHLIALVEEDGSLRMRYHHVDDKGELKTGRCRSRPEILPSGKIKLHEEWQWTCGDESSGTSIVIEI